MDELEDPFLLDDPTAVDNEVFEILDDLDALDATDKVELRDDTDVNPEDETDDEKSVAIDLSFSAIRSSASRVLDDLESEAIERREDDPPEECLLECDADDLWDRPPPVATELPPLSLEIAEAEFSASFSSLS
mmetsp:Transcript_17519/g.32839  ORF Transcript_17519/g.32839 Transcript_17519/m.32839 type:complete len:133 (-) Transcript_17519:339-737(-)